LSITKNIFGTTKYSRDHEFGPQRANSLSTGMKALWSAPLKKKSPLKDEFRSPKSISELVLKPPISLNAHRAQFDSFSGLADPNSALSTPPGHQFLADKPHPHPEPTGLQFRCSRLSGPPEAARLSAKQLDSSGFHTRQSREKPNRAEKSCLFR
jgi:hypothetical protein